MGRGNLVFAIVLSGLLAAGCSAVGQESRLGRPESVPPSAALAKKRAELTCKGRISTDGTATVNASSDNGGLGKLAEDQARRLAIQQWRAKAQRQFGSEYDRWFTADEKDVDCNVAGNSIRCRVSAKPCAGIVAGSSLPQR